MFVEKTVLEEFLGADDQDRLWGVLQGHLQEQAIEVDIAERKPKNLFVLFIQKEEYFDEILSVLSASTGGSITVLDTNNAGYYLHRMPLFSSYWTDPKSGFNRIIMAVADRGISNDIIRRINTLVGTIDRETGVLMTVQELSYSNGSLEF